MKWLCVVDFSKVLEFTMAKFYSVFEVWSSSYWKGFVSPTPTHRSVVRRSCCHVSFFYHRTGILEHSTKDMGGIETSITEQGNWKKEPVKSSSLFLTPNQSADTDCSTASESSWWECTKLAQLLWKMCGAVPWGSHKWIESYLWWLKGWVGLASHCPDSCWASEFR